MEGGKVDLCLTGMELLLLEEGIGKGIELESWGKEWNRALCNLPRVSNKQGGLELQRGFPSALMIKDLPANTGDEEEMGSIPGWGRSPGGRHGHPLQYSHLEDPTDRGAWWATVHSVAESDVAEVTQYTKNSRISSSRGAEGQKSSWGVHKAVLLQKAEEGLFQVSLLGFSLCHLLPMLLHIVFPLPPY